MKHSNDSARDRSLAWLLAVPPLMAVLGGMITLYIVIKYPDQAISVDKTTLIQDDHGRIHQHVVNSVNPPLK